MMKYLVRANWLWDGILEAQSKHIKTECSEAFQKRSLDLLVVLSCSVQALLPRNILEERALTLSARINSGGVTEECLEEQVEVHI